MKFRKLTLQEIKDVQPTRCRIVGEHRTVVGGLELSGELDMPRLNQIVKAKFGEDCAPWEGEADDGENCAHVTVYAKL